jgi:hypothetical protein
VSDRDEICDQITDSLDDLITSVDAMRWRPGPDGDDVNPDVSDGWVPPECKARFDALYASIDAFAGAIDNRMNAWEARVQDSFAGPSAPAPASAERDALTTADPDQR